MNNPYEELGVPTDATEDEIKKAYRKKAQETHPDKGGDEEEFKAVAIAFDILTDPKRRRKFDDTGECEADDRVKRAIGIMQGAWSCVIDKALGKGDFALRDLKQEVAGELAKTVANAKEILRNEKRQLIDLKELASRISRSDEVKPPVIEHMLDQKMESKELSIANQQDLIELVQMAADMNEDYEYRKDEEPTGLRSRNDVLSSFLGGQGGFRDPIGGHLNGLDEFHRMRGRKPKEETN